MTAFIGTFIFNIVLIGVFAALLRRNAARSDTGRASRRLIAGMTLAWFGLASASVMLALSTTTAARAAIADRVIGGRQPFAAIRRADPRMWATIQQAVERGIDDQGQDGLTVSIERSVRAVVQPYMTEKLAHAPDDAVVAMAGLTLAAMRRAAAADDAAGCDGLARGDENSMRRYADDEATGKWLERLIRSEPVDVPRRMDRGELDVWVARTLAAKGVTGTDTEDVGRCRTSMAMMEILTDLPEADAAAGLRTVGSGVRMVTK